jgi:hypothetical protein
LALFDIIYLNQILTSFTFLILFFQDDDEEEENVPLVRKRKQPSTSTSQPKEGGPSTQEVKEDEAAKAKKKKKKVEENTAQQAPTKDQWEEKRTKKKSENKRADAVVKAKPTIKKSKVPRALKIHTSSESGGNLTPRSDTAKNDVVELDQTVKPVGEETAGPKGDPASQLETLVKDRKLDDEGKQNDQQGNEDAPNTEKEKDNLTVPEVEAKEVYFTLFFNFKFSISFLSLN